jgi:hypothetical protein
MIDKEFVPYEQALELKELGFDEPCFGRFNPDGDLVVAHTGKYVISNGVDRREFFTLAPLFSQAFRFFREKYNLNVFIQNGTSSWMAFIGNTPSYIPFVDEVEGSNEFKGHNTYEEAELACLIKLIEIVKNGK